MRHLFLAVCFVGAFGSSAYAQKIQPTTGVLEVVQTDGAGNVVGNSNTPSSAASSAITPVTTAAVASSLVLKASAGNLYGFSATSGATAGYVMVFNATSAPGDGAVTPLKCYVLPANSTISASWQPGPPARFSTGITLGFSSTGCFTKTASATAFLSGEVQ